jgi:hypothetical protein
MLAAVACGSSSSDGMPPPRTADASDATFDTSGPAYDAPSSSDGDLGKPDMTSGPTDAPPDEAPMDGHVSNDVTTPADAEAPPDAGGCPPLETVRLPANGAPATFTTSLDRDATYLLRATGNVNVGGQMVDAEFAFAAGGAGTDVVNGVDVGIDVGLLWPNRPTRFTQVEPGPSRMKWNASPAIDANNVVTPGAAFRADSTYYMIAIGNGHPLLLKLVLPNGATGTGSIAVSLYALSPTPPARYQPAHSVTPTPPAPPKTCGEALDTVDVPVGAPTVVTGAFKTDASKIYLLQASGTAPVGAAALGDGDAEYMDFGPDVGVNGFNDGEACADFGLGVDELTVGHCRNNAMCLHRKNWWGTVGVDKNTTAMFDSPTYRNDHIYYMIYPGTGKPLSFLYFDSGYGDNKPPFDVLVRIFAMP